MEEEIDVYVRHSSSGTFLNIHVPSSRKDQFAAALKQGHLQGGGVAVELSVLPEWITDEEVRDKVSALNEFIHLRIPVTSFNISVSD